MTHRGSLLGLALVDAGVLTLVALPVLAGLLVRDSVGTASWVVIAAWAALALTAGLALVRREHRARGDLAARDAALAATRLTGHDWVWECDERLVVTDSGHAVSQLLGFGPEQCVGRHLDELLYDDTNRTHVRTQLEAAVSPGAPSAPRGLELAWRHADGQPVRLRGSAAPLHDRRGRVVGYRGACWRASEPTEAALVTEAAARRVTSLLGGSVRVDVALQPIVEVGSGRLIGAEALSRFSDGRPPTAWFDDARVGGLTRQLDEMTFLNALSAFDDLPGPAFLSVNASPELLLDAGFRNRVLRSGRPLDRLVVEVTEHSQVVDYDDLEAALTTLRRRGVRFAVDDTGAGYSSLNHVLRLRPDVIKLDRDLIADLGHDGARRALVTALVLLALEVGASVTGEGVETPDQLEALGALGVHHAQGYLLATPSTDTAAWEAWSRRTWRQGTHAPAAGR
ncbi:EAL domain-containing protein [Nocardioides iriomotensis]|nr:EAL domain-containing protein [Nocardioides iriomotensis]